MTTQAVIINENEPLMIYAYHKSTWLGENRENSLYLFIHRINFILFFLYLLTLVN